MMTMCWDQWGCGYWGEGDRERGRGGGRGGKTGGVKLGRGEEGWEGW